MNGKFVANKPSTPAPKPNTSTTTSTATAPKPNTSSGSSSAPKPAVSQQDYFLKPGESITDYNTRIAGLRGDTAEELATTQASANSYAAANPNSAFAKRLGKAGAPTNASDIITLPNGYTAPTTVPGMGSISDAVAGNKGLKAMLDSQKQFADQQMRQEEKRAKEQQSVFDKFLGKVKSPGQARAEAQQETGIDVQEHFARQEKGIKEIESLSEEYAKVEEAKDLQIAQSNDKMASMNFINNQVQQIERNAAPQLNRISANINAKAATLEAQSGNFAQAQSYINQAVQDATAEAKFNYDMYTTMYEMNEDSFDRIDSIYKDSFQNAMKIAEASYNEQLDEKQRIGDFILKYPDAGIRMGDTLSQAATKASSVASKGGGVSLTADMKNYEYAKADGYEGSFADWVNGGKGGGTEPAYKGESLAMTLDIAKELETLGVGTEQIIKVQDYLNQGYSLQQIAKDTGMPNDIYMAFSKYVQTGN